MYESFHLLLVEDNPGDVRLLKEALKELRRKVELHVASNGEEALAFLNDAGHIRPDLIIMDLNLPKLSGREVLKTLKEDSVHYTIPIIMMSSSEADQDIRFAYNARANAYLVKPVDIDEYLDLMRSVFSFWMTKARTYPEAN